MEKPDARAAFRYPSFRHFLGYRVLSVLSSEMVAVAVGWQVYELTHRPVDLGLVGLAQFLPGILLFLVAGHAADRIPRRRILLACLGGFTLASLLLLLFSIRGIHEVYPIYLVLLLNGAARAFGQPATQALLPTLLDEKHFANAVAWSASMFRTANIVGPIVGGLVYGFSNSPVPVYGLAVLCYLAALLMAARIQVKTAARPRTPASLSMILDGFRYLWSNRLILGAISLDLFAVLLGGAVALLPVYASEILKVGAIGLGILRCAPGAGAVVTAIALAHRPLGRRQGEIMLWCVFGFGVFTVIFGVSHNLALSLVALALTGATDMVSVVVRSTMVQLGTPDHMRGRVSAVNAVFIGASNEVGQFESGMTAQWFGTVPAVILGGVGTIAVVALWARWFPELRQAPEAVPLIQ
ncbi:MAG TPA: MFS transporter [Bryobacteraceae bacterium]|nr:MFS transporter [Bryobacteraceae bacterium]